MNLPPRLRFKLEKLKASLRSALAEKEENYDTSHRMCPHCRGLISRDASVCPLCDTPLRSARARGGSGAPAGRVMGGLIPIPSTATSVIVVANIALYAISWYLTQQSAMAGEGGGEISGPVLLRLGAKFGPYIIFGHQWWRLVTAIFLHGGLLHIGMNLWCLFDLGPEVESLFSTPKFIVLYLATGVFGFVLSMFWSPGGLSIGASGSIVGLIGILIGASYHHGTLGKDYRRRLWFWVAYIVIFIFLPIPVDNAAHMGGLVLGLALGYVIPEGEPDTRAAEALWNTLALLSVLIIAGSFALMALQLNLYH